MSSSKRQIAVEGKSALGNLDCIVELVAEARSLEGNHAAYAVIIRNRHEINRWVASVTMAGFEIPASIQGCKAMWQGK